MKTLKLKTNLIFGLIAIAIALIVWFLIPSQVPKSRVATEYVDGSFMPKLMAILIFVCGLICIIKSLVLKDDDEKTVSVTVETKNLIYLGALVLYGFAARYFSFLISSLLFGAFSLWFMGCRNWKKYVIVEVFVVAICLIFKFALKVRFGGIWGL